MWLLDTVVLSELRKRTPNQAVVSWLTQQQDASLFLSVVSLGEIERGIEKQRLANAPFAVELSHWLETLQTLYAERILPVTPPIARRWGALSAQLGNDGVDLLIAATAIGHGLVVVTRNTRHFAPTGVRLLNPFAD
jgi:predicted nucleic acid-binding protein